MIREMRDSDVLQILEITKYHMAPIIKEAWNVEWKDELFLDMLLSKNVKTLVLEKDEIIGYVSYSVSESLFIHSMIVSPKHVGKGYGKTLMKKIIEIARNKDIELWVQTPNKRAIEFYKKAGFEKVSEEKNNLFMRRTGRKI